MTTIQRRRTNAIKGFQLDNGEWVLDPVGIIWIIECIYENLFRSSRSIWLEEIVSSVLVSLNESMNRRLIREVSDADIKNVFFLMHPLEVPGIDGMTHLFFQKYWQLISKDICEAIRSFFSSGIVIPEWSQTLITLI